MSKFTRDQLIDRAFLRVATVMHGMWEEKGCSDTRLLNNPLIPDEYVLAGESVRGNNCREHVIPRKVICEECHKMFDEGKSIADVASFMRKYLKIVRISKDERHFLDCKEKLNLRQRMPDDWIFDEANIYFRLNLADVKIRFTNKTD